MNKNFLCLAVVSLLIFPFFRVEGAKEAEATWKLLLKDAKSLDRKVERSDVKRRLKRLSNEMSQYSGQFGTNVREECGEKIGTMETYHKKVKQYVRTVGDLLSDKHIGHPMRNSLDKAMDFSMNFNVLKSRISEFRIEVDTFVRNTYDKLEEARAIARRRSLGLPDPIAAVQIPLHEPGQEPGDVTLEGLERRYGRLTGEASVGGEQRSPRGMEKSFEELCGGVAKNFQKYWENAEKIAKEKATGFNKKRAEMHGFNRAGGKKTEFFQDFYENYRQYLFARIIDKHVLAPAYDAIQSRRMTVQKQTALDEAKQLLQMEVTVRAGKAKSEKNLGKLRVFIKKLQRNTRSFEATARKFIRRNSETMKTIRKMERLVRDFENKMSDILRY